MAAAIRMKASFQGFDDLAKKLQTLTDPKQTGPVLKRAVRQGMLEPARRARALIPQGVDAHHTYRGRLVAPGFAKRSIRVISKMDRSGQMAYALLGVRAEAYYAVQYVELGTAKMAAQPWLRPAFAAARDPAIRMLGKGLNDWIKDVAKRSTGSRRVQLNLNAGAFDGAFAE